MVAMFRTKALQTDPWLCQLRARELVMVAAVAFANKIARIVWAVMRYDQDWRPATAPVRYGMEKRSLGRTEKLTLARAKRADGRKGGSVDPTNRVIPEVSQGTSIPAN
jgi:hypothetical protein